MDSEVNDVHNIEIDDILLTYEFDRLNLENLPSDILEEISKDDEHLNIENVLLPLEEDKKDKSCSENFSKDYKNLIQETVEYKDKACITQQKQEVSLKKLDGTKDINGNEEPASDENLNHLLDELKLSDSDNEEENKKSVKLRERAPIRPRKRTSRNRVQNLSTRDENRDTAQINPERLLFLSGSNRVDVKDITLTYPSVYQNNLTVKIGSNETFIPVIDSNIFYENGASNSINEPIPCQNDAVATCTNNSAYDDYGVNFLSSPESGYETSHSLTASPPLFPFNVSESILHIPEIVDEEQILESLVDYEGPRAGAVTAYNPFALGLDENDHKGIILDYLKDLQPELNLFDELPSENMSKHRPLNDTSLKSVSAATPTPVFCKNSQNYETLIASRSLSLLDDLSLNNISNVIPTPIFCENSQNSETLTAIKSLSLLNDTSLNNISNVIPTPVFCESSQNSESLTEIKSLSLLNDTSLSSVSSGTSASVLCESSQNSETSIACKPLNDEAKTNLRKSLLYEQFHIAQEKVLKEKKTVENKQNVKEIKVIYIEDEMGNSENQTNLHKAVINERIEEIYCLVEFHKRYNGKSFSVLNLRDKNGKTAFDYAVQKDMHLVIEYLKENNACPSLNM